MLQNSVRHCFLCFAGLFVLVCEGSAGTIVSQPAYLATQGKTIGPNADTGQLEVIYDRSMDAVGSLRGIVEFDVSGYRHYPNSTVTLNVPDTRHGSPEETNYTNVLWYLGDGVVDVGDYARSAARLLTLETARSSGARYDIDMTSVFGTLRPGDTHLGVRYEAATANSVEEFGRPTSFNQSLLSYFTFEDDPIDILANSVTVTPRGGEMKAKFEPLNSISQLVPLPTFGLDPEYHSPPTDLTSELGIDHFNWRQEIEAFTFLGVPDTEFVEYLVTRGTGVDPLFGGNPGQPGDNFEWYYDETVVPGGDPALRIDKNHLQNFLSFSDIPNLGRPGLGAIFTTYLAGVKTNHAGKIYRDVPGVHFRWKYTEYGIFDSVEVITLRNIDPTRGGDGVVEFLGFLDPEDWDSDRVARLEAAGIEVAYLGNVVPEPSSISLVGAGVLGFLAYGWRRRRGAVRSEPS